MTSPKSATHQHSAESAAAQLALLGVVIEASAAANVAAALKTQIAGSHKAFAALPFEAEPAAYLSVSAEEAP